MLKFETQVASACRGFARSDTLGGGSQLAGSIEQLEVALWPEYDRQAVLVMYTLPLEAGQPLADEGGPPHSS